MQQTRHDSTVHSFFSFLGKIREMKEKCGKSGQIPKVFLCMDWVKEEQKKETIGNRVASLVVSNTAKNLSRDEDKLKCTFVRGFLLLSAGVYI